MSETRPTLPAVLRAAARGSSLVTLALLGLFFTGIGQGFESFGAREWSLFAFFPVGFVAGLLLAWRFELAGGLLALGSVAAFYVVHLLPRGEWPRGWAFLVFASPAVAFLASALVRRRGGDTPDGHDPGTDQPGGGPRPVPGPTP